MAETPGFAFNDSFKKRFLFFGRRSGIHGLGHLFRENAPFFARLFWALVLLASSGCLYLLLVPALERGAEVNYTPDTLYLPWRTEFPAVTVCEAYAPRAVQRKLAEIYPDLMQPLNFDFKRYVADLLYARGACKKNLCVPCGDPIPCDLPWRNLVEKIHKSCPELIAECNFNGNVFPCCQRFHSVDSEHGPCYSFNTLHTENVKEPLFSVNRSTGPGVLSFRLFSDAQISVHSTEELSTNGLNDKFKFDVRPNLENRVEYVFSVVDIVSGRELLNYDIGVRNCRYTYEIPKLPFHNYTVYSFGACVLASKTEHSFQHCKCVHPVRDISYKDLFCNFTGLNCLVTYENRIKGNLINDIEEDDCFPSCVESELSTIHVSRAWRYDQPGVGTLVKVQMSSLPTLRYQRSLIRTDLDLVVSVGGMVGLFFSASILSLVEVVYLILRTPN